MQRYLSLRVQTALYLSVFFLGLHHVFVYFTNASIMKEYFHLDIYTILGLYGVSSIFGICVYLLLFKTKQKHTKNRIYIATIIEFICLGLMYVTTITDNSVWLYITAFIIHHTITPYILFNLDKLFEDYTHIQDRGKGRGIYLTMWNTPFIVVPLMLSALSTSTLALTYSIAFCLLIPFVILIHSYIQNPVDESEPEPKRISITEKMRIFWSDTLDRKAFITQACLHLYYGSTGILLPIYLHEYFGFEWGHIGALLAVITTPFILVQIPFGKLEDKNHNEKRMFAWGVIITIAFTIAAILVSPSLGIELSYFLLLVFLFISRVGCSLIEISSESLFYKHVTERDEFALLAFRSGRLVPYALGIVFFLFFL